VQCTLRAQILQYPHTKGFSDLWSELKDNSLTWNEFPKTVKNNTQQARSNPTDRTQAITMCTQLDGKGFAIRLWLWHDAGHQSDVDVVQWHPNSHYVATGSSDRSIRLWDIRDASTARVFVGHRSPVSQPAALSLMQIACKNASGTTRHECD